jgi:hypothetical protein
MKIFISDRRETRQLTRGRQPLLRSSHDGYGVISILAAANA